MEEEQSGLEGEDAEEEGGGLVDAASGFGGGIDEGSREVGEREAEEAGTSEREQGEQEPKAIGPEVPEEFEGLGKGFAIEPRLGKVDAGLIVPRVTRHAAG